MYSSRSRYRTASDFVTCTPRSEVPSRRFSFWRAGSGMSSFRHSRALQSERTNNFRRRWKPDAPIRLELRVLRVVPGEVPHCYQRSTTCARQAHIGIISSVPASVPKRGPRTVIRDPTPTNVPIKNGPEIVNFRPVPEARATLANRRLQPLGHLTAARNLSIYDVWTYAELVCPRCCP